MKHQEALIEADTRSGITDCSTPLFQRVRNIVERLATAEAEKAGLRSRLSAAALADDCHHCDEAARDDEPCRWCGHIRGEARKAVARDG